MAKWIQFIYVCPFLISIHLCVCVYPFKISNQIETRYCEYLTDPNFHRIYLPEYYDSQISFTNKNRYIQTTKNGLRSVFRFPIKNDIEIVEIIQSVVYNNNYHYKFYFYIYII